MPTFDDTPFARQTISKMTNEQLNEHVASMRERRLSSLRAYEEAKIAKAKQKEEKDIILYERRLEQVESVIERIEKAHKTLEKYLNDINVLRLSIGDNPWENDE